LDNFTQGGQKAMAKRKTPQVVRITVDERLSDDLVRLLIAPLAAGVNTITDRDEDWGPEQEVMVSPANYAQRMGVREDELSWHALAEGQVFLVGEFEAAGAQAAPDAGRDEDGWPQQEAMVNPADHARQMGMSEGRPPRHALAKGQASLAGQSETGETQAAPQEFQVRPGGRAYRRIDNLPLVKDSAKQLYAALIRRKEGRDG
jgi:hypothetical protein